MNITFEPRLYQETILNTCKEKNTLIVLPTGLGKTKTAILASVYRLKQHPTSYVLFLTPTKPLANQITKEYKEATTIKNIVLFTGSVTPEKREEQAKTAQVIVSTPQTISNDIINEKMNIKNCSLLILDEAHRCTQDYDYVWIAKQYITRATNPRIIGLTASPGSDKEKIKEICHNAYIEAIEIRTEDDEDVKPYIQETNIETYNVDLPQEIKEINKILTAAYTEKLMQLKTYGIIEHTKITKKDLLEVMRKTQGRIAQTKDFTIMKALSVIAEAIKVDHAIELTETQSPQAAYKYLDGLFASASRTKTKAVQNLVRNPLINEAYRKIRDIQNINHPKLTKLIEIIKEQTKEETKTIIFNQYRDNAVLIKETINIIPHIKAEIFVGQTKKGETGLSQKEQLALVEQFAEGKINTLISTSIAEEGLDIPNVDNVIFYEPVPSAIRSIQRRGRTARHSKGKVMLLITKNTRDEVYHWIGYHKEKNMYKILKEFKETNSFEKKKEQKSLTEFKDEKKLTIIVDNREKGSGVAKELIEKGIKVETQNLAVGDYLISERICIERKTPQDFVDSMIDKRLFTQVQALREHFLKPLIIIEGEEDIYSLRNIHPNAIKGMLATIAIGFQIPILYTKNAEDTAELIKIITKHEQIEEKKEFPIRLERKPTTTKEMQEYIIESLPFIGPTKAKALLKKLKTVKNIINASPEELQDVEKLGIKTAEEIYKIIHEEYGS